MSDSDTLTLIRAVATRLAALVSVDHETWPMPFEMDLRIDRRCFHITIASHVQRPPKLDGSRSDDKCTSPLKVEL